MQIYDTHQSLAYKWVQGYLSDKQLIDQSYKLLDEYVKQADGETILLDQAELQSLGDAVIRASYNLESYPDSYRVESFPTLRMLAKACLTNIWE